jgi:hypothetical protein
MITQEQAKTLAIAVPTVLLTGFLVFAGYGWLQEHDGRVKAEAQTGQQQKQIEGLKQQQSEVQMALDRKLALLEEERRRPATATQLVSDASSLLPNLPQPLQVLTTPENPALPDGPTAQTVVIPEADLQGIRDAQLSCQENTAKLAACQALEDDGKQQIKLTEEQRDEWKIVAKGGSIWHRALGAAKWFAVGAGAGVGVYAATHHK